MRDVRSIRVAIESSSVDLLRQLLLSGDGSLVANSMLDGWPLLVLASFEGKVLHVRLLLDAGAHPDELQIPTDDDALSLAAIAGHIDVVSLLMDRGCEPNRQLPYSRYSEDAGVPATPFYRAVEAAPPDVVDLMARRGGRLSEAQCSMIARTLPQRRSVLELATSIATAAVLLSMG